MSEDYAAFARKVRAVRRGLKRETFDTGRFEEEFGRFSHHKPAPQLRVKLPKVYALQGQQKEHYGQALASLGLDTAAPKAIDIIGDSLESKTGSAIIIVTPPQLTADYLEMENSYLNPVIRALAEQHGQLLTEFTVNEAMTGRLVRRQGMIPIDTEQLAVQQLRPGPYTLELSLETPKKSLQRFQEYAQRARRLQENPFLVLDPQFVTGHVEQSVALRNDLGALARYAEPQSTQIQAETTSCLVQTAQGTYFHLYAPDYGGNIIIYFGTSPVKQDSKIPQGITIIDGNADAAAVRQLLLDVELLKASEAILEQRVYELEEAHLQATATEPAIVQEVPEYVRTLDRLKDIKDHAAGLPSQRRAKYFASLAPEYLDFFTVPNTDDVLVHLLLPRLSWRSGLREYHNTRQYLSSFEASDEAGRKLMLRQLAGAVSFEHEQNNAVNVALYLNHRQLCESVGIRFSVVN